MGHVTPSIRLATVLLEAGHEVMILTNGYNKELAMKVATNSGLEDKLLFPDESLEIDKVYWHKGWK